MGERGRRRRMDINKEGGREKQLYSSYFSHPKKQ
jgi:hypothetical protein